MTPHPNKEAQDIAYHEMRRDHPHVIRLIYNSIWRGLTDAEIMLGYEPQLDDDRLFLLVYLTVQKIRRAISNN